jgi:flagellar FliL protein
MSDPVAKKEDDATEENPENIPVEKKVKGKKTIIIIAAALSLLLIGGGVGFYLYKAKKAKEIEAASAKEAETKEKPVAEDTYYDLDPFTVNLDKGGDRPNFLKMSVTLQLSDPAIADKVRIKTPLIRDTFQVYLRELRADDLQGSAGIYRLREELLLRLNKAMAPDKVKDILFKEILVQ